MLHEVHETSSFWNITYTGSRITFHKNIIVFLSKVGGMEMWREDNPSVGHTQMDWAQRRATEETDACVKDAKVNTQGFKLPSGNLHKAVLTYFYKRVFFTFQKLRY